MVKSNRFILAIISFPVYKKALVQNMYNNPNIPILTTQYPIAFPKTLNVYLIYFLRYESYTGGC